MIQETGTHTTNEQIEKQFGFQFTIPLKKGLETQRTNFTKP